MIYEYPEEFVVPVVYVDDLNEKAMNRKLRFEYYKREKLVHPGENLFQEPYEKDISISNTIGESLINENEKNALNEIDNEYVNSEILRI